MPDENVDIQAVYGDLAEEPSKDSIEDTVKNPTAGTVQNPTENFLDGTKTSNHSTDGNVAVVNGKKYKVSGNIYRALGNNKVSYCAPTNKKSMK